LACQAFVIPPSASRVQAGSLAGRPRISYYRPLPGESGSGKELVARALHQLSPRRERRFCDVNCAAADDLLESELFGHLKGAFTGAVADRAGLIEEANGGTLFLDEVTDLSPRAQAKLSPRRRLTHSVLAALARYHWPGNVRELQNVLAGVAVSAPSRGAVKPGLLPPIITGAPTPSATRLAHARDQFERRFIELALARAGGRRARAARELGLSRQGLLKMMARLGIQTL